MRKETQSQETEKKLNEIQVKLDEHFEGVWVFGFHRDTGKPFFAGNLPDGPCGDVMETFLEPLCEWELRHRDDR